MNTLMNYEDGSDWNSKHETTKNYIEELSESTYCLAPNHLDCLNSSYCIYI